MASIKGLFSAILDAIHHEDERIGGQRVTRLTANVTKGETSTINVESTNGFGEYEDGENDALLLIGGELIQASGRTTTTFTGLTRGTDGTDPIAHPEGRLVYDLSQNASAIDHVRRGFLVNFAIGEDLDVIGSNLGLTKCPDLDDDTWREIIKTVAYLPKNVLRAYYKALEALVGTGNFNVSTDIVSHPFQVFVEVAVALATSLEGRFFINGGEQQETTGTNTVDTDYDINHVLGVYDDTLSTRRGFRDGLTNYFTGGSFAGNTITLGSSPGGAGTKVIVDYGAFEAHYLADDETVRHDEDFYAYLTDPLVTARCLMEQIRMAGIKVNVSAEV